MLKAYAKEHGRFHLEDEDGNDIGIWLVERQTITDDIPLSRLLAEALIEFFWPNRPDHPVHPSDLESRLGLQKAIESLIEHMQPKSRASWLKGSPLRELLDAAIQRMDKSGGNGRRRFYGKPGWTILAKPPSPDKMHVIEKGQGPIVADEFTEEEEIEGEEREEMNYDALDNPAEFLNSPGD